MALYNEDCLTTMSRMEDNSVDMVLTSPPYDNIRSYEEKSNFNFEKTSVELFRIIAEGGVMIWIVGDQTIEGDETGTSFKQALHFKEIGFKLFDTMIYAKECQGAVGNNKGYWQAFEYMFVLVKGKPTTINLLFDRRNSRIEKGWMSSSGNRRRDGSQKTGWKSGCGEYGRRTNVWKYKNSLWNTSKDKIAFQHPAIFPEALARDHILSWSNKGDLIYDPFMGSGTTAKMCIATQRNWIGSEINENYCDIIRKRIKNVQIEQILDV